MEAKAQKREAEAQKRETKTNLDHSADQKQAGNKDINRSKKLKWQNWNLANTKTPKQQESLSQ